MLQNQIDRTKIAVAYGHRFAARGLYWSSGLAFGTCLLLAQQGGAHAQGRSAQLSAVWSGQTGTASYYGASHEGRRTASGAFFDQNALTAAHPWLPFGTRVRVTALETGRSVVVTITDRFPSTRRVIDLSFGAAQLLGFIRRGIAAVELAPA